MSEKARDEPMEMILCVKFPNAFAACMAVAALEIASRDVARTNVMGILPPEWIDGASDSIRRIGLGIRAELDEKAKEAAP